MMSGKNVVITGGAGYIGSLLAARLLACGHRVTIIDSLSFGADGVLGLLNFDNFKLIVNDITEDNALDRVFDDADWVMHLAAIVGFPSCDAAGKENTWNTNFEGTRRVYEACAAAGVERLIFASSYSNYGVAPDDNMVNEETELAPLSSYGESKAAAETYLLEKHCRSTPLVTCLRLATVFGVTARTRFDLMVNQFALQAHRGDRLVVYEQDLRRSFVHVVDVCRAIELVFESPGDKVAGEVFNVGSESLNASKMELIELIRQQWPCFEVEQREMSFSGDMRSLSVSFEKIRRCLDYEVTYDLTSGLSELKTVLESGWIFSPGDMRHVNHAPLIT